MKLTSRPRARALAAVVGLGAAALGFSALPATAAVTCPTVSSNGTVSPPPVIGGDWSGCDLAGANMEAWKTYDLNVSGANLTNADIFQAQISGGDWTGADLTGADMSEVSISANLTDANLSGADLSYGSLAGADISGAIMATATLTSVWTLNTTGVPASLPSGWEDVDSYILGPTGNAADANLTGADLTGLDLDQANLGHADLSGANLSGTDLGNATLNYVQSGHITGAPSLPSGWADVDGYLIGPTADLNAASLAGADLSGMDLNSVNLAAADLDGADLSNATLSDTYDGIQGFADLYQTDLEDANLTNVQAQEATITDANLTDATLTGSDLTDANLANSDVGGADLSQATLTGVQSGGMTGTAALPADWAQAGGYIVGPGANLSDGILTGLTLSGDDLDAANLTSADLTSTDLASANLNSANLTSANLTSANLASANLTNGELASANLTNASLDGATITSADFTGVTWLNTTCPDGSNSNAYDAGCFSALDTSPPAADPEIIEQSPVNGWYAYPVMVEWNWTDPGKLVASECPEYSTTTRNGPFKLTVTCTDLAGNIGIASMSGKVDASAPVVTITRVTAGRMYAAGHVPAPGCATKETISGVGTAARLTVSSGASHGIGPFTATCAGAMSVAGVPQKAPVSAQYAVGYGFGGFIGPRSGGTIARSSRSFAVTFRLLAANGAPISAGTAKAFAWAQDVRAELTGLGIKTTLAWCGWRRSAKALACTFKIPAKVRTGRGYRYELTVQENVGTGWHTAPVIRKIANPEVIHFR